MPSEESLPRITAASGEKKTGGNTTSTAPRSIIRKRAMEVPHRMTDVNNTSARSTICDSSSDAIPAALAQRDIRFTLREGDARAYLCARLRIPPTRALRLAITGGIGSGKSTFTRALAENGHVVADADLLARDVVAPGSQGLNRLTERFGSQILTPQGELNRAALAALVFHDEEARRDLNAITHPLIAQRAHEILSRAQVGQLAIYDVPLLTTTQEAEAFDAVIVVSAPEHLRVERLMARGLSAEDAQRRIAAQISDEQRARLATIWVENLGNAENLAALARGVETSWLS